MATFESKSRPTEGESSTSSNGRGSTGFGAGGEWDKFIPQKVDKVGVMSREETDKVWQKLYSLSNQASANEDVKKMIRVGVYGYCALNGTSREGSYAGVITLNNGSKIQASVIPAAAGLREVRRFMRGNMTESYNFLKYSAWIEKQPNFIASRAAMGIGAHVAFATADWLTDCEHFTPEEVKAHSDSFNVGIARARRARDGKTLEAVEEGRVMRTVEVQGPAVAETEGPIHF